LTSEHDSGDSHPKTVYPVRLATLFGLLYFIQGFCEPTDGLLAQPINSLLKSWGQNAAQIGAFVGLLGLPWAIKPVYGLISDFIPLAGHYRKSYLILASAVTSVCFVLAARGVVDGEAAPTADSASLAASVELLAWLLIPATVAVAFSDVVVDALLVEKGQPHGLTGRLQAVQWGALSGATVVAGSLGGYLSHDSRQASAFLICGAAMLVALVACTFAVSDRRAEGPGRDFKATLHLLRRASASRTMLAVGAFMFLWNFNPFSMTVLYMYLTQTLQVGEEFYGHMLSLHSLAGMAGSFLYGLYCRRVRMSKLIHISIVMGILSTVGYWFLVGKLSALAIAMAAGLATATATVIQFDLAAQVCPPQTAGTLFALLMGLSNLGTALSVWLGGWCYQRWQQTWSSAEAFNLLVAVGAAFTAGCWFVVPFLLRSLRERENPNPSSAQRRPLD
jgi:MFS family permease